MWPPACQVYELSQVRSALEVATAERTEAQLHVAHLTAENHLLARRVRVLEDLLGCDLPTEAEKDAGFSRALGEPRVRLHLGGAGSFVAR